MSHHYQWQRHQAQEKIAARMQDGEAQRRIRQAGRRGRGGPWLAAPALLLGAGLLAVVWLLLTGCSGTAVTAAEASAPAAPVMADHIRLQDARDARLAPQPAPAGQTMAARIRFQDGRDQALLATGAGTPGLTMAERIEFQDARDHGRQAALTGAARPAATAAMTMADRHRFHDRLAAQQP